MKIAILGAGAWGTALAIHLTPRHQVTLWSRNPDQVQRMGQERENRRYLPGCSLPPALKLESDLSSVCPAADLLIVAVPAAAFRSILQTVAAQAKPLIWVCKGLEPGTGKWLDQVAEETLPRILPRGVLSGPSFAQEVAAGLPAALTLASQDRDFAATDCERTPRWQPAHLHQRGCHRRGSRGCAKERHGHCCRHFRRPGLWQQCPRCPHHPGRR